MGLEQVLLSRRLSPIASGFLSLVHRHPRCWSPALWFRCIAQQGCSRDRIERQSALAQTTARTQQAHVVDQWRRMPHPSAHRNYSFWRRVIRASYDIWGELRDSAMPQTPRES